MSLSSRPKTRVREATVANSPNRFRWPVRSGTSTSGDEHSFNRSQVANTLFAPVQRAPRARNVSVEQPFTDVLRNHHRRPDNDSSGHVLAPNSLASQAARPSKLTTHVRRRSGATLMRPTSSLRLQTIYPIRLPSPCRENSTSSRHPCSHPLQGTAWALSPRLSMPVFPSSRSKPSGQPHTSSNVNDALSGLSRLVRTVFRIPRHIQSPPLEQVLCDIVLRLTPQ